MFPAVDCFQEDKWKTTQLSGNNGLLNKLFYVHSHWNNMLLYKKIIYADMERVPWLKITESKTASIVLLYLIKLLISYISPGGWFKSLFTTMMPVDSECRA